jgi:hypothetical protein
MWGIWLLAALHSTGLGEKAADKNGPLDCQAIQEGRLRSKSRAEIYAKRARRRRRIVVPAATQRRHVNSHPEP